MNDFDKLQALFIRTCDAKLKMFQAKDRLDNDPNPYPYEPATSHLHGLIIKGRISLYLHNRINLRDAKANAEREYYDLAKQFNQALQDYGIPVLVDYQSHRYKATFAFNQPAANLEVIK